MKHKKFLFMLLAVATFLATVKAGDVYERPEPGTHLISICESIGWGHLSANIGFYQISL